MTEYKKIKILQVIILSLTSLLILLPPILANAQPMVHVRYNGTNKINYDGMTAHEFYKKTCDAINQQYKTMGKPSLTKPFKVTGSFKDLEAYTEEVYISPKNSYHATYKSGYTIKSGKLDACDIHIIPRQQNTIIYYDIS